MGQGVIISQSGIPVNQANDYQKALDSRWKFMEISIEQDIDISLPSYLANGTYAFKLFDHGLNYLPGFEIYEKYPYTTPMWTYLSNYNPYVSGYVADKQSVYVMVQYSTGIAALPLRVQLSARVYALDITTEYQAPSDPPTTAAEPTIDTIGAAFTNQAKGGSVRSTDPETFTLYTPIKSIAVHKTGTQKPVSNIVTITHNVNYPPTYLVTNVYNPTTPGNPYTKAFPDSSIIKPLSTTLFGLVVASANTLQAFGGPQTALDAQATFAYVILKDPAQVAS